MATIVIGGQASGVGKTALVCALLRAMPERRWTAVKVTLCDHGPVTGGNDEKECHCALRGRAWAIDEETDATVKTDTSRFLAAGAAKALWVRARPGALEDAMREVRTMTASGEDVIFESNAVLEFVTPDVYALVVSPQIEDFKRSARRWLGRADGLVVTQHGDTAPRAEAGWVQELLQETSRIPRFEMRLPEMVSTEFVKFVRERIER